MAIEREIRYCSYCGGKIARRAPPGQTTPRLVCTACGDTSYESPRSIVVCLLFSEGKLLLIRRATPPFVGRWAPPGGYAEKSERLQDAAVRELFEETGIGLAPEQLIPQAIASVPHMNQFYIVFRAHLPACVTPAPGPEAEEARWFGEDDFPLGNFWRPKRAAEVTELFAQVRLGRYQFYLAEADGLDLNSVEFPLGQRFESCSLNHRLAPRTSAAHR